MTEEPIFNHGPQREDLDAMGHFLICFPNGARSLTGRPDKVLRPGTSIAWVHTPAWHSGSRLRLPLEPKQQAQILAQIECEYEEREGRLGWIAIMRFTVNGRKLGTAKRVDELTGEPVGRSINLKKMIEPAQEWAERFILRYEPSATVITEITVNFPTQEAADCR